MTSFRRSALPVAAMLGLLIFGISKEAASQQKTDFVVLVLPEPAGDSLKCGTIPDTLRFSKKNFHRKPVIGFQAVQTDVTVSGLNGRPVNNPSGPRLSDSIDVEIKLGHLKRVPLNRQALGTYPYTVMCDTIPDAPPAIIVDP